MSDIDELIAKYDRKFLDVYEVQTVGAYTYTGMLVHFLAELQTCEGVTLPGDLGALR